MAFFHAQASTIHPIQPRHDHSSSANGSTINDEVDAETAALIANLTLDNLDDLMGSHGDSLPSDEAIAYLLQCEQLDRWLSSVADAKVAKIIDSALVADAAHLDALITAEEAAVEDRIAAEHLSRGEALPVPKSCQTRLEDPNFIMNPEFIRVREMEDTQSDYAGPDASNSDVVENYETLDYESTDDELIESESDQIFVPFSTAQFRHTESIAVGKRSIDGRVKCLSCLESFRYYEALKSPCDHYYCRDCLVKLVEVFTRDESLFPLRCCQNPIPTAEVLPTLSLELRSLFLQKNAEFSIFAGDRLFCSNPNCCAFLGSSEAQSSAIKCPHCRVNTCPRCKDPAHPGEGCGVSALQALAISEEWQTCPGCNMVVELNLGCNHITCQCKTQFCYLCAALWKTCDCAQ